MAPSANTSANNPCLRFTSGRNDPVWIVTRPYVDRPRFSKLGSSLETEVVVVGAGIAGISTAYELVQLGMKTVLIEAREVLSGESGRSDGCLSAFLGMSWKRLTEVHGAHTAKLVYESHRYAAKRVEEISENHGIDCDISVNKGRLYVTETSHLKDEIAVLRSFGGEVREFSDDRISSNDSQVPHLEMDHQTCLHPIKYAEGILNELITSYASLFSCYTHTRMKASKANTDSVVVEIEDNPFSIEAKHLVLATNVPVHSRTFIMKNGYYRTYHIAMEIRSSDNPDYISYDESDSGFYMRSVNHPDKDTRYLAIRGGTHKTGFEDPQNYSHHFERLLEYAARRFTNIPETPAFAWSSQIVDSNDHLAYLGRESPGKNVYVITGDSGSGLAYAIIGAKIVSDQIVGVRNPWESVYEPSRKPISKEADDIEKRHLEELVAKSREEIDAVIDIEELPKCQGKIRKRGGAEFGTPLAVYKDGNGDVRTFTGVCPHAFGALVWNSAEKTFDCPLHGSRFDAETGKCVFGPANKDLKPEDDAAKKAVEMCQEV